MVASMNSRETERAQLSRSRASTAPAGAGMHRLVMPGHRPQSIHTSDLFFTQRPSNFSPHPPHAHSTPPPPVPPLPSPLQRTMTAPPPIPPKPTSPSRPYTSFSATSISPSTTNQHTSPHNNPATLPINPAHTQSIPTTPQLDNSSPDRDDSEDGLALALAISQSEAHNDQKLRDKLSTQEEQDLARALRESLMFTGPPTRSSVAIGTFTTRAAVSSYLCREENKLLEPVNHDMVAQDEALALRLALEEAGTVVTPTTPITSSPPAVRETSTLPERALPEAPDHATFMPSTSSSAPPTYTAAVRPQTTTPGSSSASVRSAGDSKAKRSSSLSPNLSQNAEASTSHTGDGYAHSLSRVSSTISLLGSEEPFPETNPTSNPNVVNVNNFVDKKLFKGVSIGFFAPPMSTNLITTLEVMPNIISLPYGKCPPLHLQGPSWRHLLMLMARLSGTRLEATLEAVAVSKVEMNLRTVIQFVKPLRTSSEWRTVLYFTLDYPSPRPGEARQGVNVLPYSYSLSTIPTLLREAADTPISKTYTIPASDAVPYPTLPITFPNLAMYLHAALEDSRRYLNDSSSGNRKLAKMVQACYPSRAEPVLPDAPERSGVGGLFKRVMGRGNNKSSRRGGNEDTYELVTPFVPDEWG